MDPLALLNEHFLSCNICTEIFKDPCTIHCYHTFCRGCLTSYTQTRLDAITAKSILCPNCNQMTKVPRPQEPVDQWCYQFKPSFLIQGLLDTFTSQESSDHVQRCCFACQQIEKTTQATSVCEDCDIMFCEACAKIHVAAPNGRDHIISPLGAGSPPQFKKRKVMCKEHNCVVEFCCKDCQKSVCNKCCIIYHRKCTSVNTLESMVPQMKQVLQQNYDEMNSLIHQTGNTLKRRKSEVEDITQNKSSLQSEIRRVSQQAVDLIRRKEKKLLDELDTVTEKQTEQLRGQIKSGEFDLQTYQQYTELIKQSLQSDSSMEIYDMYTLCQSGEITAEIQKHDRPADRGITVLFDKQLDVNQLDQTFQLGQLKYVEDKSYLQQAPRPLFSVSIKTQGDTKYLYPTDIEVLNVRGIDTLVVTDLRNSSVKSYYTKGFTPHCTSLKLDTSPLTLTKISQDMVAVSHVLHNSIELIKLTPDPVHVSSINTEKKYRCMTALSDTTLAAGCVDPPSIDVLDLSGRVLRSVTTPSTGQPLIQGPRYMCTTRQGHIVVVDAGTDSVHCVTQQGEVLYSHRLTVGMCGTCGGVTTTDTGSVIVADYENNKIIELSEQGQYVRDLLTERDGIAKPRGIQVHRNKLYVSEVGREHIKIFQL